MENLIQGRFSLKLENKVTKYRNQVIFIWKSKSIELENTETIAVFTLYLF